MPKVATELTALDVKRMSHPGGKGNLLRPVGGVAGLCLQLTPGGARTWVLRTTIGGRRRDIGLGGYPTVTLADARQKAREARAKIEAGVDPIEERKAARAALIAAQRRGLTFSEAVDRALAAKLDAFKNAKHRQQWRNTLDTYAAPEIGKMLCEQIGVQDVLRVLQQDVRNRAGVIEGPLWNVRTETAARLRQRIEAVLAWATVGGHRTGDNPARWKGNLDHMLPKAAKVAASDNQPALALADAARWWADLRQREGTAARALEFLALTAARSGEVRGMTWGEVDLDAGLWVVPAARMKAGREHRVPLPAEAVALLKSLPRAQDATIVFAAPRGGPLSDMTLSAVMRRMQEAEEKAGRPGYLDPRSKRPAVPHGLRSTFRDWAAERTEFPRELAEMALAHNVGSEVERAYRRADMVERRRTLMAAWGRFLRGESAAKVVRLGDRGAAQ